MIEILVVLALTAVLARQGFVGLQDIRRAIMRTDARDALLASLQLARQEAVIRNGRVVVCALFDSACVAERPWNLGWTVFHDGNNNLQRDAGEQILARQQALDPLVKISANKPVRDYVSYGPGGGARLKNGAFQAGSFTICVSGGVAGVGTVGTVPQERIAVQPTGLIRLWKIRGDVCPA